MESYLRPIRLNLYYADIELISVILGGDLHFSERTEENCGPSSLFVRDLGIPGMS